MIAIGRPLAKAGFACTRCGACCHDHRVPLTHLDVLRLATVEPDVASWVEWLAPRTVDMAGEPESFVELRRGRRLLTLAHRASATLGACVFWSDEGACGVYAHRPLSCRTYPLEFAPDADDGRIHLELHPDVRCDANAFDAPQNAEETRSMGALLTERRSELEAYLALVTSWNGAQRRRHLAGRPLRGEGEFLAFLMRAG